MLTNERLCWPYMEEEEGASSFPWRSFSLRWWNICCLLKVKEYEYGQEKRCRVVDSTDYDEQTGPEGEKTSRLIF